jgi:hypothetical protein
MSNDERTLIGLLLVAIAAFFGAFCARKSRFVLILALLFFGFACGFSGLMLKSITDRVEAKIRVTRRTGEALAELQVHDTNEADRAYILELYQRKLASALLDDRAYVEMMNDLHSHFDNERGGH